MDQKIKNFDRSIEQKLNESEVAPPFGMWNRISAQLDVVEALPVAAAAPVALVSKRHVAGFIAAAALISTSLITAYVVNSYNQSKKVTVEIPSAVAAPTILETSLQPTEEIIAPVAAVKQSKVAAPTIAVDKTEEALITTAITEQPVTNKLSVNVNEVAVPSFSAIQKSDKAVDTYYFPPVDVNNEVAEIAAENETVSAKANTEEKVTEKKISKSSSSSSDKRIKIRRHNKRGGFTYGSLNRLGKHRPK